MPLFISHTLYLEKFWNEKNYPKNFLFDGILGTILSDIRYITKQDRKLTHLNDIPKNVTYGEVYDILLEKVNNTILSSDAKLEQLEYFKKGFVFHSILDYWWPKQLYFPSDFKYFGMCLKFTDEIIKWPDFQKSINKNFSLPYKIRFLNLPEEIIEKWYHFIFNYFKTQPTSDTIKMMLSQSKMFDESIANRFAEEIKKIEQNIQIKNKLHEIFNNFSWSKISNKLVG